MNKYIDINRLWALLVRELLLNKRNIPIMFFSMILLFLLLDFSLLNDFFLKGYGLSHSQLYPVVVLIYCLIVTSTSFSEMNSSDRKIDFMMLPASVEEKFAVKFFYTTVVFIIISIAALSISAVIVELIRAILGSEILFKKIFNLYSPGMLFGFIKKYLALHAVFFFGAIYFKKLEFGKTILTIVVMLAVLGLYLLILNYIPAFKNTLTQKIILQQFGIVDSQLSAASYMNTLQFFRELRHTVYFISVNILPLVLWGTAYLRLREEEVDNGI